MAGDILSQRIEVVERQLQGWQQRARAAPEQPLLAATAQDLALAVDELKAARDELQKNREWLPAPMADERQTVKDLVRSLEQEQQILQTIMEHTPAQLAYLDPEFNFVRVNAAYADGSGHSKEELIGRNHFDLFPNPENEAIFLGVRDIGQPVTYQARPFQYTDQPERGTTYWDWTLVPVNDEAGGVRGLVISLADVTERVRARHERERLLVEAREQRGQAEEASRTSRAANRLLQALIETMPIGVVVADGDGTLVTANAAAQAILGSPVIGQVSHPQRAYTPHHPDGSLFPQQDMPLVRALYEGKVIEDVEVLIRRSDGSASVLLASAAPVMDDAGKVVSAVTVFQDITEQRYAEGWLRFKADILAQIADAVIAVDGDERVTYLNQRAAELYEVDREEALGCALDDLYRCEWLDPGDEQRAYASLHERGHWQSENVHLARSGNRIHVESVVSALADDQGRPSGKLATIRDVTAQKEAEAERDRLLEEVRRHTEQLEEMVAQRTAALQNAEKLAIAGQLGASLAHEINNPLQSVIGCLGLAEKHLEEGRDVSRYLWVAREELRRAASIVAQLRDLHRLSEPEDRKPIDPNALLEQVLLLCKKKCEECRIRVSWKRTDDLPSIFLVSDRIKQVFLNLVLNALDAMPEGGCLEVSTSATTEPTGVSISFADTGPGIAPDALPHVFDPFYSTKAQGLGLGLYITRTIVGAHGGRIDVSSHVGEGTIFSVWLPA